MNSGEIGVWRVRLDELPYKSIPPPTPGELARADRFLSHDARHRYLKAHCALRGILGRVSGARLDFAITPAGKPYLPAAPEVRFNLSRSHGTALIAVAIDTDIGVDIERLRPVPEYQAIAERFFPPSEWEALAATPAPEREREFFRRWTRIEASLKAAGVGLYGAGAELEGPWTIEEIGAGEGFAAAVAALRAGMAVRVAEFEDGLDAA